MRNEDITTTLTKLNDKLDNLDKKISEFNRSRRKQKSLVVSPPPDR